MTAQTASLTRQANKKMHETREALKRLIACLKVEQNALGRRDKESLFEVLQTKQDLVEKINAWLGELSESGINSTSNQNSAIGDRPAGRRATIESNPGNQKLWQDIHNLATRAVEMNCENANIIQLSRSFFYEYLNQLKDFRQHAVCYHKQRSKDNVLMNNILINRMT